MRLLLTPAVRSAAFYVGSTVFCSLVGKVIVTRFFFDYPVVILMLQMATTLFLIELLRVFGIIKLSPYSFDKGRHCFLPSILLCIAQWLTVVAFEGIGMPAFEAVKRITPLVILLGASAVSRQSRLDHVQLVGIAAVSFSSFLTVNFELSLDQYSLFYGLLAAILQGAAYLQFESLSHTYQALELLYMHAFNSLIVFLIADVVQDEIRDAFMYMMTSAHPLFASVFAILLVAGILLQFSTFVCIEHNGALNTQIISNIRAAFQVFIAYFLSVYLFYDVSPGIFNYMGLLLTIGAAYYVYNQRSVDSIPQKTAWTSKA
uniref:TPT domain-containing protein n=1 Tax=Haemonchus contortus TaxID=6289 RepID=A0A7I4YM24_HAECO|nr:Drug/Metabolite transporter superfamily [Haemonchus contortus]CDJ97949.1 UDP-sugar transporter-like protein [Haemonchus contortus]